jgi:hypothetical protein
MRSESKNAFSAVLSTEGRGVGVCWAHLNPKGPKGLFCRTSSGVRLCWELEEPEGPKWR